MRFQLLPGNHWSTVNRLMTVFSVTRTRGGGGLCSSVTTLLGATCKEPPCTRLEMPAPPVLMATLVMMVSAQKTEQKQITK